MPTDWERIVNQDRIRVWKAHLFYRYKWAVQRDGERTVYVLTWRDAMDLAIRWAYTGEHP